MNTDASVVEVVRNSESDSSNGLTPVGDYSKEPEI